MSVMINKVGTFCKLGTVVSGSVVVFEDKAWIVTSCTGVNLEEDLICVVDLSNLNSTLLHPDTLVQQAKVTKKDIVIALV